MLHFLLSKTPTTSVFAKFRVQSQTGASVVLEVVLAFVKEAGNSKLEVKAKYSVL